MLPINRIGGARGGNGGTLDDIIARLDALVAAAELQQTASDATLVAIQALYASQGAPGETDCGETTLAALCGIKKQLGGLGAEASPPVFRCLDYVGGYIQALTWVQMSDFSGAGGGSSQAYRAVWENPVEPQTVSRVTSALPDAGGNDVQLIYNPGPGDLTVCASATIGSNIEYFYTRRYSDPALTYQGDYSISSPDDFTIWAEGAEWTMLEDRLYVVYCVVTEGSGPPHPDTSIWLTEGEVN